MSIARNDRHPGRSVRPFALDAYEARRAEWMLQHPDASREDRIKAMRTIMASIPVQHVKVKSEFV